MNTLRSQFLFLLLCLCSFSVRAQTPLTWADFVEQFFTEDEDDTQDETYLYELLEEIHRHPINLNQATEDDLRQLPFLAEDQIRDIIAYRDTHLPIQSTGELMFVGSLSKQDRNYLQLFCHAGKVADPFSSSTRNLLSNSHHEVMLRGDIPFYRKAGFRNSDDDGSTNSSQQTYRGDPFYTYLRYTLDCHKNLFAGFQFEKDAGERGIDYYSAYILLKDINVGRNSKIREAVVGNYRASFGLGLVLNTGVSMGKDMMTGSLGRMDQGFSRHSSTMESGYLTGAALRYQYRHVTSSVFCGYTPADGTFRPDSFGLSSLKTDGLHRTPLEHSKRHNLNILNLGGNLHWDVGAFQLSATAVFTRLSVPLAPGWTTPSTLYRKYNAQGQHFQTYSLAYGYSYDRLRFTGETAFSHAQGLPDGTGRQQGFATLNTLQYTASANHRLTLSVRYYSARFTSLNGRSFSENSRPQNEGGIYLAWKSQLLPSFTFDTYVDLLYFPWLKSGVSDRSYGIDGMLQASYTANKSNTWTLCYRAKAKQKDYDYSYSVDDESLETATALQYDIRHNLKLQNHFQPSERWGFRTQFNLCLTKFGPVPAQKGFAVSENILWTPLQQKLSFTLGVTYFNTDDYNNRVYAYEPSLPYSFGLTAYYYHGFRSLLLVKWTPLRNLTLTGKLAYTHYLNQSSIGTGTELIAANHKEDLQLMLRFKF